MTKTRTKFSVGAILAALFLAALSVLPFSADRAVAEGETYNVASLFYAKAGASTGSERVAAAYAANGLPAYLHDADDAGYKSDFSGTGTLLTISKSTSAAQYVVRSAPFSIADNTEDTLLISAIPAGAYNNYYDRSLADIPATTAYDDTANWPPLRDLSVRVVDAADPGNYFTVDFSWATGVNASYYLSRVYAYAPGQSKAAERGDGVLRPSIGGALVQQSYWGNTYVPFTLYYDAEENALYTDTCNAGGAAAGKTLIRDFGRTYDNDAVTWDGFTGDSAYVELWFRGGNATSRLLVQTLDGLNLACDEDGLLDGENAAAYNAAEDNYFAVLPEVSFEDGVTEYAVPPVYRANLLYTENDPAFASAFTVRVSDDTENDITATAVTGLDAGKWTENAVFIPPAPGGYTFTYTSGDTVLTLPVNVSDKRDTTELLTSSDSGAYVFEYDKTAPDYMTGAVRTTTGLGIRFTRDFTLTYTTPIDLRHLTADTPLISYLITPAVQAEHAGETTPAESSEFTTVTVRLTDAEDEDTYVDIMHVRGNYGTHLSFVTAAASGQTYANNKQNKDFDAYSKNNGATLSSTFTGYTSRVTDLYFDGAENVVSASPNFYSGDTVYAVRDLDDPRQQLASDTPFAGFGSGRVRLSITFSGLRTEADSASLILYSIAGQTFSSDKTEDVTAPRIFDNDGFLSVLPEGETGTRFPFPSITASDVVDGDLTGSVTYAVYSDYGTAGQTEVAHDGSGFVPAGAGAYTIVATVRDIALNETVAAFPVTVVPKLEFLRVKLTDAYPAEADVGSRFRLPGYTAEGGSGLKTVNFTATAPDGSVLDIQDGAIVFDRQGVYTFSYEITDYLGTERTIRYYVMTRYSDLPILSEVTMPAAVLSGRRITFARPEAYDYISYPGENREADVSVYVTEPGGTRTELGDDLSYTPTAVEGELTVEYVATALLDRSKSVTAQYSVPIVTPDKMGDYFVTDGVTVAYVAPDESSDPEAVFTAAAAGGRMTFVNALPGNDFTVTLRGTAGSDVRGLKLILVDSADPEVRIELSLTAAGSQTILEQDGQTAEMAGSFAAGSSFRLDIRNSRIYDSDGIAVATLTRTVYGDAFAGFGSGKVYMTLEFTEIGSDGAGSLSIWNLINQPRFYETASDYIAPFISLKEEGRVYRTFGTTVSVSAAIVTDVLDPGAEGTLTVTAPDGTTLYNAVACDRAYELRLTQYGTYTLTYRATDIAGNLTTQTHNLVCADDVPPVIEIDGAVRTAYKTGDTLIVNSARATDNVTPSDGMTVSVMIIEEASGKIDTVGAEGYTFGRAGRYTLRYFVEDGFKNYRIVDFAITVS